MNVGLLRRELARNLPVFEAFFGDLDPAFARRRPEPGKWSLLEILNHLVDEEREDFRTRLDYTLHRPGEAWPGIDPEGWVGARAYNERDFGESLAAFLEERRRSLEWLEELEGKEAEGGAGAPDLDRTYLHPVLGEMRAGDVAAAWAAHDLLHLAQAGRTRLALLKQDAEPHSTRYAGA